MRRQAVGRSTVAVICLTAALAQPISAAEPVTVRALVPTFAGPTSLGANVSTILALRLWTTLRPRPNPNPQNLYFGFGQIEWSRRVLEPSPEAAMQAAAETRSDLALWGDVEEYGPGVVVAANMVIPPTPSGSAPHTWSVTVRGQRLELGLPDVSYQFSPLLISNEVVARYSRPNQIRVCKDRSPDCVGGPLGNPFRGIRIEGDFALVRQPSGATGWVPLPNLSEAQGEVIDFTAAFISYLRGDYEQSATYFTRVRDSNSDSLVRNDAALLAGISQFRMGRGTQELLAAHKQNPYSLYAVQALATADMALAGTMAAGEDRNSRVKEASGLLDSYRHLFAAGDPWLQSADRALRRFR